VASLTILYTAQPEPLYTARPEPVEGWAVLLVVRQAHHERCV